MIDGRKPARTIDDVTVSASEIADDHEQLVREHDHLRAEHERRTRMTGFASLGELKAEPAMTPAVLLQPHVSDGSLTVIFGAAAVPLPDLGVQWAAAVAEGPSPDHDAQRTESGRELPFAVECRERRRVLLMVLGPYHYTRQALEPIITPASDRANGRLDIARHSTADAMLGALVSSDWGKDGGGPRYGLVIYDLTRFPGTPSDVSALQSILAWHGDQDPLDRPAAVFLVRTDVFSLTWLKGLWVECDRVLLASDEGVGHARPRERVSLVNKVPPRVPRGGDRGGGGAAGGHEREPTEQPNERRRSFKEQILELAESGFSQADIAKTLGCNKSTVSRHLASPSSTSRSAERDQLQLDV